MASARRLALLLVAACSGSPRPAPQNAAPSPEPPAVASSEGAATPWPAATIVPAPALRTDTRPLPHDLAQLRSLGGVEISPDGSRIAYVVRAPTFDPKATPSPGDTKAGWKIDQQLFVVARTGGEPRQLTFGSEPVRAPRFSPDGERLAFLRQRDGKTAIHVLALAGGEPQVIGLGDFEPEDFGWSPDGKAFSFTSVRPATDEQKAERWKRGGARAYDREWQQTHLFVVPATGGEPRHVNRGTDTVIAHAWSPDGKWFALITAASSDPVVAFGFHKLVVVQADGGGADRVLNQGDGASPYVLRGPAWSPDSRRIGYLASTRGGMSHMDELRICALDGKPVNAAGERDPELTGFVWSGDGRSVIAAVIERTTSKLYRFSLDGRTATELPIGKRVIGELHGDRAGRYLVASASTPTTPNEPVWIDAARGTTRSLAAINPQLRDWKIARNEVVTWKNAEGTTLEGVLTVTSHARPGAPPPLIVIPHGGPDGVSMEGFHSWAQFFAARGYSVFAPNYRGGLGYGRSFYEANRGRLGEIEHLDIESGVDHLIATGKADPAQLFFGSWSWGGYLSAWTLGHTDRYRAIMVGAGVVDTVIQYVTSDINHAAVADWEFKTRPWAQPGAYDRSNPARYLVNARTPTLIIHGENDNRVPFVNAQILYRALHDRGVPVTMWAYPREAHGFGEPAHVEHMMERWAAFFDEHRPK
ncbi:MAG: prolyl oligopeptidase family serine peptidase [Kofleriaceae bacterium]